MNPGGVMEKERWNLIETIIDTALTLHGDERTEYIAKACSEDDRLIAEVYSILRSVEEAERVGFMEWAYDDNRELINDLSNHPKVAGHTFQQYIGRQIGPFKITEFLGSGGMGSVFKAIRTEGQFRQEVAVKLVREGLHREEALRRFRLEQEILANLNHPNIARLYDGGMTDDGIPYLVMEFIDGIPVNQYCDDNRLTLDERLTLFKDICGAVQFAHSNLVVHRDIKAQNIYVTPDRVVKILDFGVAKLLNTGLTKHTLLETQPGQKFWTPQYAAPEQVTGEPVTTSTDIYALGVLLHKLFTGTYPLDFEGKSLAEIEKTIKEISPSSPSQSFSRLSAAKKSAELRKANVSEIIKQLKGDLDALVLKAIRKEPEYRYASISQLIEDIERYQTGNPLIARRGTLKYRTAKFFRRHRTGLAVAAILLISAFGFAGFYTSQITQERDRANHEAEVSREVKDFLVDLFEVSDPEIAMGELITTRELLDRGTQRISELTDPALRAELSTTLGVVHQNMGLYEPALQLFEEALELWEETAGNDHPDTFVALNDLGRIHNSIGDFAAAESIFTLAIEGWDRYDDKNDTRAVDPIHNLAVIYRNQGRYEEAEELLLQAWEMRRVIDGDEDPQVVLSQIALANTYKHQDKLEMAEPLLEKALTILRQAEGDIHPQTLNVMSSLAGIYSRQERFEEAEKLLTEALEGNRKVVGEEHNAYIQSLDELGIFYFKQDDYPKAEQILKDVLDRRRKLLGPENFSVLVSIHNLASVYGEQKKYEQAEPLLKEVLELRLKLQGEEHFYTQGTRYGLALLAADTGRPDEALFQLKQAVRHGFAHSILLGEEAQEIFKSLHGNPEFEELMVEVKQRLDDEE